MQGDPLNISQFKLLPRLLLASLVVPAAAFLHQAALWLYPAGGDVVGYLWYAWVLPFYDISFALLVLAPFIVSSRRRWMRILALVVATAFIYFVAVAIVVNMLAALAWRIESPFPSFTIVVPTVLFATALLAAATAWLSPLQTSHRYWFYTGLAGLVTGVVFLIVDIMQGYTHNYGNWLGFHLPYLLWPVATCLAIYYGHDHQRAK